MDKEYIPYKNSLVGISVMVLVGAVLFSVAYLYDKISLQNAFYGWLIWVGAWSLLTLLNIIWDRRKSLF